MGRRTYTQCILPDKSILKGDRVGDGLGLHNHSGRAPMEKPRALY